MKIIKILLLACVSMSTLHAQQLDRLTDNQNKQSTAITSIPEVSYYHIDSCEKGACNMVKKTFRPSATNPIRTTVTDTKTTPIKIGTSQPHPIVITQPNSPQSNVPDRKPTVVRGDRIEPLGPIVINQPGGTPTHGIANSSFK